MTKCDHEVRVHGMSRSRPPRKFLKLYNVLTLNLVVNLPKKFF